MRSPVKWCVALAMMGMVSACSGIGSWWSSSTGGDKEVKLAGDRLSILSTRSALEVSPEVASVAFKQPAAVENISWPQRGATPSNVLGALKASGFEEEDSVTIGDGNEFSSILASAPVVADGVIYAMDARGYVSAHKLEKLKRLWVSDVSVPHTSDEILGGGLAVAGTQLFVTTGQGWVYALNMKDGSLLWKKNMGVPLRAAPKMQQGALFVSAVDDQLFALDSANGGVMWKHRGLGERVGFLSAVSPAIGDNIVVVAYGSGEVFGLAVDTGIEVWGDSLSYANKTSAISVFSGFAGDPVVAGGVAFAASRNGLTAATHVLTGRRLWEKEISAVDTPWLGGNFLFMLTPESELVALHVRDGGAKWVHPLERFDNPERQLDPYRWFGPYLLGEQLLVFGSHGVAVSVSPESGAEIARFSIPKGLAARPVVVAGKTYIITDDAKLHLLQ